jgi:predicted thioredoxin/glutaredoxin
VDIALVTRQNCHLCDDALASLRSLGVEPEFRDVDADDQLHALYDWRVPVVLLDGRVVAEGRIDLETLRRALKPVGKG